MNLLVSNSLRSITRVKITFVIHKTDDLQEQEFSCVIGVSFAFYLLVLSRLHSLNDNSLFIVWAKLIVTKSQCSIRELALYYNGTYVRDAGRK